MHDPAIFLVVFYLTAKAYARYWLFKPMHARPVLTRPNEVLRLMDLAAWIALVWLFFVLLSTRGYVIALVGFIGLLGYDLVVRQVFLRSEVRRLCSSSPKWQPRAARRHVRRRSEAPMFH